MAWTQVDLDAIEAAIASGKLDVQYSDKRVRYRSIAELLQAREVIRAKLAAATQTKVVPKQTRLFTRKGWD